MQPKHQDDWCDILYREGLVAAEQFGLPLPGYIVGRAFCFAIAGGADQPHQMRRLYEFFAALIALLDGAANTCWLAEEPLHDALRHLLLEMQDEAILVAQSEEVPKN